MTSNPNPTVAVLPNNTSNHKLYLTNSISLHENVNHLVNNNQLSVANANNNKGLII
jgi:hypothetical protein